MTALTVTEARGDFANVLNRVEYGGERIVIQRRGKDIVALIPIEDAEILDALEDRIDIEEARRRLADGREPVPYGQARKALGLR